MSGQIALKKYSLLGKLFLGDKGHNDDYYIDGFIAYLDKMTTVIGLPGLKKYGLEEKDIPQVCSLTENKNNPVKLSPEVLQEIISARL